MPLLVTEGALLECPFGKVPVPLVVTPTGPPVLAGPPVATVMDHEPMVNIATFGVCNSPANPACLNPAGTGPCVPATVAPWAPGSVTVRVNGLPALTDDSICECTFGGVITITDPGQVIVQAD